jgi:hypothetical protein
MYIYAGMPEKIAMFSDANNNPNLYIGRNSFFYLSLAIIVLVNGVFMLYSHFANAGRTERTERFINSLRIWANGLLALVNLFFITALIFLSAFNSLEKLDLFNFGLVIYVALGLIFLWTLGIIKVLMEKNKI